MNENIITAFACGTNVVVKGTDIKGIITAITIRFGSVIYKVTYYYKGIQESVSAREQEFITKEYEVTKIGFK